MRVSKMVRLAFAAVTVTVLGACADSSTSPTTSSVNQDAPVWAPQGPSFGWGDVESYTGDDKSGSAVVWLDPSTPTQANLGGGHSFSIPANTICNPSSSSYGKTEWDQPCDVASHPFRVTVRWATVNNTPVISFTPDLRFVPTTDPKQFVVLTMKNSRKLKDTEFYNIAWYDKSQQAWVNESVTDPTLASWIDKKGNSVSRRLKHFSGYSVVVGFAETTTDATFGLLGW
jgi:hypothetical protein